MDPNTRQAKRTPVTLKIKFKSATLEEFIERYAVDVSHGGIFIRTKEPLAVGTSMKFEFQLKDATPLIHGEGTVVWTRENDPARPGVAPGMGVRFDRLGEGSQSILDKILAQKAKSGSAGTSTVDPKVFEQPTRAFSDAPTKVAPSPLVGQLAADARAGRGSAPPFGQPALGQPAFGSLAPPKSGFQDERTDATPLPNPVPFHSDADEFPEEAFEEATKVRSVEELVAQTAKAESEAAKAGGAARDAKAAEKAAAEKAVVDELAARRAAREKDEPAPAPAGAAAAKAEPAKPAATSKDVAKAEAKVADAKEKAAKAEVKSDLAKAEVKAAKAEAAAVKKDAASVSASSKSKAATTRPTAAAAREPEPEKKSSAGPVLFVIVALVAAAAAAYFLWYKPKQDRGAEEQAQTTNGTGVEPGTAGTMAATGTDVGTAAIGPGTGTAAIAAPDAAVAVAVVEPKPVTINAPKGATVEIVGTEQKGPAPFTAKLDPAAPATARVTMPGMVAQDVEVTGGGKAVTVKLVAMPTVLRVESEPSGASIYLDGKVTGKVTPADVKLSGSQASASRIKVTLRKQGFERFDTIVKGSAFEENGEQRVAEVTGSLKKAAASTGGKTGGGTTGGKTGGGTTTGTGATTGTGGDAGTGSTPGGGTTGTGTTGTGTGTGGTTGTGTGTGGTTGTGTGTGTAKPPAGTGTGTGTGGTTGTGTGTGTAKPPAGTGTGTGTAKPPAGTGTGTGTGTAEPTPDWAK